jgi:hypothetical protein
MTENNVSRSNFQRAEDPKPTARLITISQFFFRFVIGQVSPVMKQQRYKAKHAVPRDLRDNGESPLSNHGVQRSA